MSWNAIKSKYYHRPLFEIEMLLVWNNQLHASSIFLFFGWKKGAFSDASNVHDLLLVQLMQQSTKMYVSNEE